MLDVTALLGAVRVPTLVLHARGYAVVPIAESHILAAGIRGAQFVELDSRNHVLLENEPAWGRFCDEVLNFTGLKGSASSGEDPAFALLSPREREVLSLITEGLANAEIAERLSISEKTVRNDVSNLFDKLGVWTRAQAIVFCPRTRFPCAIDLRPVPIRSLHYLFIQYGRYLRVHFGRRVKGPCARLN